MLQPLNVLNMIHQQPNNSGIRDKIHHHETGKGGENRVLRNGGIHHQNQLQQQNQQQQLRQQQPMRRRDDQKTLDQKKKIEGNLRQTLSAEKNVPSSFSESNDRCPYPHQQLQVNERKPYVPPQQRNRSSNRGSVSESREALIRRFSTGSQGFNREKKHGVNYQRQNRSNPSVVRTIDRGAISSSNMRLPLIHHPPCSSGADPVHSSTRLEKKQETQVTAQQTNNTNDRHMKRKQPPEQSTTMIGKQNSSYGTLTQQTSRKLPPTYHRWNNGENVIDSRVGSASNIQPSTSLSRTSIFKDGSNGRIQQQNLSSKKNNWFTFKKRGRKPSSMPPSSSTTVSPNSGSSQLPELGEEIVGGLEKALNHYAFYNKSKKSREALFFRLEEILNQGASKHLGKPADILGGKTLSNNKNSLR